MLAGAMGFVSCGDDAVGDDVNKTYVFSPKIEFSESDDNDALQAQQSFIRQAFQSAGFAGENLMLELSGKDSTAVSKLLMDKMAQVEKSLQDSPVDLLSYVGVRGIEKQYANADDEHIAYLWYKKNWGTAENGDGVSEKGLWTKDEGMTSTTYYDTEARWVHNVRTREWGYRSTEKTEYDNNYVRFGFDTNKGNGGDYVYVYLDVTYGKKLGYFTWDDTKHYITDVIAVYDSSPASVVVGNRTYYKCGRGSNLNNDAPGKKIYLYYTTDPYPGYEGYYLTSGINLQDINYCCRMLRAEHDFQASDHVRPSISLSGHRIVDRVVQAYYGNGSHDGELNTNRGAGKDGCDDWIRMILTYASKAAIYN